MSAHQGRNIAIVGGSGTIGTRTISALLSKNVHTVTAISRADSTATFPEGVTVKKGAYDDAAFLVEALKGQDVLLLQLGLYGLGLQDGIIRAAAKAGVKYILPTEFGSDVEAKKLIEETPLLWGKAGSRQLIQDLGSSWIAVVNNPWFDWSLGAGLWGIDVKARKAALWNGGNFKINTSTLQRVGDAVAALLSLPEDELVKYKNKPFYISSFYVSQRDMLDSVQRVTGTTDSDWTIQVRDIADVIAEAEEEIKKGNEGAFINKFYSSNFKEGYGGDYNHKVGDLQRFGLQKEDLDEVVKGVVESLDKQ